MKSSSISFKKKLIFSLITILIVMVFLLMSGELLVRLIDPQEYLFPRWEYSARYGSVFPAETTIISGNPGRWKFTYTTNKFGLRGEEIPVGDHYERDNIVILGDSFSFGQGVNNGEEYPAVLAAACKDDINVINISCPGWGLTQQLRRYHDLGRLYNPKLVIIQFCGNDLIDNYKNMVTKVESGKLVYQDTNREKSPFMIMLSKASLLQKSQLYCFIRNFINKNIIYRGRQKTEEALAKKDIPPLEKFYADLLEAFAQELRLQKSSLIIISPGDGFKLFPYLKKRIDKMESDELITYIKVKSWFDGVTDYGSPEGHCWGKKAHDIVGRGLAEIIGNF
jgi:lysophospholipase L1-like esterase